VVAAIEGLDGVGLQLISKRLDGPDDLGERPIDGGNFWIRATRPARPQPLSDLGRC
jgi:hypothetical protein